MRSVVTGGEGFVLEGKNVPVAFEPVTGRLPWPLLFSLFSLPNIVSIFVAKRERERERV